jgi:hypothetical protein
VIIDNNGIEHKHFFINNNLIKKWYIKLINDSETRNISKLRREKIRENGIFLSLFQKKIVKKSLFFIILKKIYLN